MDSSRQRPAARTEDGQAAVALVAAIPVLIVLALALLQFVLAGHALLTAAGAARAAARAEYVGEEPGRAAKRAMPPSFREGAEVEGGRSRVTVELDAPRALPLGPRIPVSGAALLGPAGGVPGG